MLKRIYIDNYRCFANFELSPGGNTLLIGRNGSGKSSLFDAIEDIKDITVRGREAREVLGTDSLTRWDERPIQRFELELTDPDGPDFRYELVLRHTPEDQAAIIEVETVTHGTTTLFQYKDGHIHLWSPEGPQDGPFPAAALRSFIPQIAERPDTTSLIRFRDLMASIQTLRLDAAGMESTSTDESGTLDPDGQNFSSWYRHLVQEDPKRLAEYFQRLSHVIPGFQSLKLAKHSTKTRELVATMRHSQETHEVGFEELSDGQRVLIVLYALLLDASDEPRALMLDEPGNYLAIEEIQPWLLELAEALGDHGQLLVASHNPEVVDHLASRHTVLLERPDGGPVRMRTAQFDRESGLKASVQLANGLLERA